MISLYPDTKCVSLVPSDSNPKHPVNKIFRTVPLRLMFDAKRTTADSCSAVVKEPSSSFCGFHVSVMEEMQ